MSQHASSHWDPQYHEHEHEPVEEPLCGYRLVRVILLETVLVALFGLLILGLAWEAGYFKLGLAVAAVVWIGISPIVEIATVRQSKRH